MRTAWAETKGKNYSDADDIKSIQRKSICGPLLTCTDKQGTKILLPAPADSLCLAKEGVSTIYRLIPETIGEGEGEGEGTDIESLLIPIFPLEKDKDKLKGKPAKDTPKFWTYEKMEQWLLDETLDSLPAKDQGVQNLPIETRTHVSIKAETQTAKTGHLFQTTGLDFSRQRLTSDENKKSWGWEQQEFGLACQFSEDFGDGYRTIGGESRLGQIERIDNLIPVCPTELASKVRKSKGFRLILATPAIFSKGYIPQFINKETMQGELNSMTLKLHAVAVPRWQAGTSWDMAANKDKHKSKNGTGMRSLKRLTPAGTVYWFELIQPQTIEAESFWLTTMSDERANDGYGLTLMGNWTIPEELKYANEKDNT